MTHSLRQSGATVYVILLLILAGFGISAAANSATLIPAALPFALILILGLRLIGAKGEQIAWATFTVWLGSTYLQTNSPLEYVLLLIYVILAVLGIFNSPYLLAAAWLFHPVWDFLPRDLPPQLVDLPTACILFDIPIGLYLLWGTRTGRFQPFADQSDAAWLKNSAKTLYVVIVIASFSYAIIAAAQAGAFLWLAVPLALLLIVALYFLGSKPELLAWAAVTGWVGMTYAHTGGMSEALLFFAFVALSALGTFRSPWFLALAWLLFIPWNFVPHNLPESFTNFSLAYSLFNLTVALYLAWGARGKRWLPFTSQ